MKSTLENPNLREQFNNRIDSLTTVKIDDFQEYCEAQITKCASDVKVDIKAYFVRMIARLRETITVNQELINFTIDNGKELDAQLVENEIIRIGQTIDQVFLKYKEDFDDVCDAIIRSDS